MKKWKIISITVALFIVWVACDETESDHGGHEHQMENMSKVVKQDGIQIAIDMMTMANHKQMMQAMKIESMQHGNANHYVSITLIDLASKKMISDASDVNISITSPDGTQVGGKAEMMSGGGMHHYGKDFSMSGNGVYKVSLSFVRIGKKQTATAEFEM